MQPLVFLNDDFIPAVDARISAFDAGFLFGAGVFETLLATGGRPWYFHRHLERLRASCGALGIEFSASDSALRGIVGELLSRNGLDDIETRVKILVTPGDTSVHISHRGSTVLVSAIPYIRPSLHIPWKLSMPGIVHASSIATHKTTSYLAYRMALHAAHSRGFDDVILFDRHGHVAETSVASLLVFREGQLLLPASPDALRGITRGVIAELVRENGMEVAEVPMSPHELTEGGAVCVCNALLGPYPVARINETEIPTLDALFLSSLRESWEAASGA
ncbi:MAG: aminotransferase class IV [Bacteroidetes bacterium]|nr:aminotransferase class IV [Bacteroidota bacterium]